MKVLTPTTLHVLLFCILGTQHVYGVNLQPFNDAREILVDKDIERLIDPSFQLNILDVSKSADFEKIADGIPNLGISGKANWLRFRVDNESGIDQFSLRIGHHLINELDIYLLDANGITPLGSSGHERKDKLNEAYDQTFLVPIISGESAHIYIRVRSFKQVHMPIYLGPQSAVLRSASKREFLIGGMLAIIFAMALYNLFIFASTKDKSYLWYVCAIVFTGLAQVTILGYGIDLIQDYPWLAARISRIFVIVAICFGVKFARTFIGKEGLPKAFNYSVYALYTLLLASLFVYLFVDPVLGFKLSNALSGISALYLLVYVAYTIRHGYDQAIYFLIGWAPFLIGVMLYVMKDEGVIEYSSFSVFAMPVGATMETILLALALAERIRKLRIQKEASQKEALARVKENEELIRSQNRVLEIKVSERTAALQATNEELKKTQSQLVDAEKMASLGQLTAGIAHEINNPINFITSNIPPLKRDLSELLMIFNLQKSFLEQLGDERSKEILAMAEEYDLEFTIEELGEIISSIDSGARRTVDIVRGLRNFSRLDEGDAKLADINDGIRSTISFLPPNLRNGVDIELDLEEMGRVRCLPGKLNQLVLNFVNNALHAVKSKFDGEPGGKVVISSYTLNNNVVLEVQDNGIGMNKETKNKVFEPFYTTKDVGDGTGLGLSISHGIAESHQGRIEVDSEPGMGSTFRFIFPLRAPELRQTA